MTKPAASPASAPAKLALFTTAFANGNPIPAKYAYGMPDGNGRIKDGGNINPELRWSGAPEGTKSYALIVVDPDVPAKFDDANQVGKIIPENYPRQNFYHWVLFDIPVSVTSIAEGQDSQKVLAGGKPVGTLAYGTTGPNDYSKFGGTHGGYDGCCPPWNDERLHHYHFIIYALDVPSLNVRGAISGITVKEAMKGHVLAKAEVVGTYTNNPRLSGR